MQIEKYISREIFQVVKLTEENFDKVLKWVSGKTYTGPLSGCVMIEFFNNGIRYARIGEYIIKDGNGNFSSSIIGILNHFVKLPLRPTTIHDLTNTTLDAMLEFGAKSGTVTFGLNKELYNKAIYQLDDGPFKLSNWQDKDGFISKSIFKFKITKI